VVEQNESQDLDHTESDSDVPVEQLPDLSAQKVSIHLTPEERIASADAEFEKYAASNDVESINIPPNIDIVNVTDDISLTDVELPCSVAMMLIAYMMQKVGDKSIPSPVLRSIPKKVRVGSDVWGLEPGESGTVILTEHAGAADNQAATLNLANHQALLGKYEQRLESAVLQLTSKRNELDRRIAGEKSMGREINVQVETEYLKLIEAANGIVQQYKADVEKQTIVVEEYKAKIIHDQPFRHILNLDQMTATLGGYVGIKED
jgi:hypothetical protein